MLFYVIAVLVGVWLTLRKLDVRRREPEQFPNVERAAFDDWKARALAAENIGSFACFVYIPADLALQHLAPRVGLGGELLRGLHLTLFVLWIGGMISASVLRSRARQLQRKFGINLDSRAPEPGAPK